MNIGDDSGPCPRCKGPTTCHDYDEAPWGYRGNYTYSCEKCGEFTAVTQDVTDPTPPKYIYHYDNLVKAEDTQLSDKAMPGVVDICIGQGFEPGELIELTTIKPRLPASAIVCSEARRCRRCGRLESICDSHLYGDCIDYRR